MIIKAIIIKRNSAAPPFLQSMGRGDQLFWGTKDWVVWCKSKKGAEEIRSFELSRKEIFSNYDETKSKEGRN